MRPFRQVRENNHYTMEALLNDFSRVFLLELVMVCALTVCGCYTTYTDIHFRQIPNGASWGLVAVGVVAQGLFWLWGQVELAQVGLVLLVGFAVSYVLYIYDLWLLGGGRCQIVLGVCPSAAADAVFLHFPRLL
ncbi:MAG: hypothetical protein F4X75_16975 [Gemmatimonadetes bacterium]|nr:hypothetical protein [Gemmatimonadota bacterium]